MVLGAVVELARTDAVEVCLVVVAERLVEWAEAKGVVCLAVVLESL